jgi:hypothetical protein
MNYRPICGNCNLHLLSPFFSFSFKTMTIDEHSVHRVPSLNNAPPLSTRKKNPHSRTQSISTQPVTQKKKHNRRGSLPTTIHVTEANKYNYESPTRSPFLLSPIPPLPEKGAIAIHIANPKSDVIAASHYNFKHENALKNMSYILTWYFFSTLLSLYNKNLMGRDRFNFNFPLLVSAIHAGIHSVITALMMWFGGNRWKDTSGNQMTMNDYIFKVVSKIICFLLVINTHKRFLVV